MKALSQICARNQRHCILSTGGMSSLGAVVTATSSLHRKLRKPSSLSTEINPTFVFNTFLADKCLFNLSDAKSVGMIGWIAAAWR